MLRMFGKRVTKKELKRLAMTQERVAGTHSGGAKYVVAMLGNTFGTGETKDGALGDLAERLNIK